MKQLDRNTKFPGLHFTNSASGEMCLFQHSQFSQLSIPTDDAKVTYILTRCSLVPVGNSAIAL